MAWSDGGTIVATGNSFAAPHIAGLLARIIGRLGPMTTSEAKTVLRAQADNVEP